jgi:hypothetical protein
MSFGILRVTLWSTPLPVTLLRQDNVLGIRTEMLIYSASIWLLHKAELEIQSSCSGKY